MSRLNPRLQAAIFAALIAVSLMLFTWTVVLRNTP